MMAMLAGKGEKEPFSAEELGRGVRCLENWAKIKGQKATPSPQDLEQAPKLRLLQALLRACGDPDAEALDAYCWGSAWGITNKCRGPRR